MNYILKLKHEIEALDAQVDQYHAQIKAFREFLHTSKFIGVDGGERKDWISTKDVMEWLWSIESTAADAHDGCMAARAAEIEQAEKQREQVAV